MSKGYLAISACYSIIDFLKPHRRNMLKASRVSFLLRVSAMTSGVTSNSLTTRWRTNIAMVLIFIGGMGPSVPHIEFEFRSRITVSTILH
jgi:hypothetical protein